MDNEKIKSLEERLNTFHSESMSFISDIKGIAAELINKLPEDQKEMVNKELEKIDEESKEAEKSFKEALDYIEKARKKLSN
jgi:uncharacterized protein (DUF927 family)